MKLSWFNPKPTKYQDPAAFFEQRAMEISRQYTALKLPAIEALEYLRAAVSCKPGSDACNEMTWAAFQALLRAMPEFKE